MGIYQHWDEERTIAKLFGDEPAVREMAQAFLAQYPKSISALIDTPENSTRLADELHSLRSLFGIFHADAAHTQAVTLDRALRAGTPIASHALRKLAAEMRAFVRELEHFLAH